jgi:hypothetical protein
MHEFMRLRTLGWVLLCCLAGSLETQADDKVLFREDFSSLEAWEPFFFPNINRHTRYTVQNEGHRHVLMTASDNSASALVHKRTFDISAYPIIRWSWKIGNVYAGGNYRLKTGDDYPMRVMVMFAFDPENSSGGAKIKYGLAKKLYGQYPPQNSLHYIWANRSGETDRVINPFTGRAVMMPLENGPHKVGQWVEETVNVMEDYRRAFGKNPPPLASLAIMNDSDNTGERSTAYMAFIEVRQAL